MDSREIFEVPVNLCLETIHSQLQMLASLTHHPRFPRYVRKTRALIENLLLLIDTFEERFINEFEHENEEVVRDSANFVHQAASWDEDAEFGDSDVKEWIGDAWSEHQDLVRSLSLEEEEYNHKTRRGFEILRFKVLLLRDRLLTIEQKAQTPT
jgi:hypothetical protein